jgi:hypothetical protein
MLGSHAPPNTRFWALSGRAGGPLREAANLVRSKITDVQ